MRNHYSFSELIKTIYSFALTKLFFHNARLIRRPVYIRGKNSICGANGLTTGRFCRFDLPGNKQTLFIGGHCEFGEMTHIVAHNKVMIGDNVLIASKCFISDTSHGSYSGDKQDSPDIPPGERKLISSEVIIGNNVWIGENVVILSGASIGDGCIIGANSIVTKKIENGCVIVDTNRIFKKWDKDSNRWERVHENTDN